MGSVFRADNDITADGERFMMIQSAAFQLRVVTNWLEELKAQEADDGQ